MIWLSFVSPVLTGIQDLACPEVQSLGQEAKGSWPEGYSLDFVLDDFLADRET